MEIELAKRLINHFYGGFNFSRQSGPDSVYWVDPAQGLAPMQRDDWYSTHRDPADFPAPETIGDYAARRALSRLGARKVKTCQVPVIFEAPVACALLGNFVYGASGGSLYRKASFLVDSLGKKVFSPLVQISERPDLPKGLASGPFDNDGVATRSREVVTDGVLNGYFLSVYTARKLGMRELKKLDKIAYVRFASVYRNFEDVDEFSHAVREVTPRSPVSPKPPRRSRDA